MAVASLAEVHEAAERIEDAVGAIEEAIAIFQAKGATACVERAEAQREQAV